MSKSKKYFRKRPKTHKVKSHHKVKTHKRDKKSKMRKNKKHHKLCKSHKSKRYRKRGGGGFPLPQGLVNSWWNLEHGIGKIGNNWNGRPSGESIFPTDQPELIHYERSPITIPDLTALNETASVRAASILNSS